MKLSKPAFWLAASSLALVLAVVYVDVGAASPGALTTVHERVDELAGLGGCAACHGDDERSMDQACGSCHEPIARQVAAGRGFHGTLVGGAGGAEATSCGVCHLEHHGDEVELAGERAFALAGVAARDEFAHERLAFELAGVHATLDCAACHEHADAQPLPAGEARFLGLRQACDACHEDPHEGELGQGCAECHGEERPFDEVAAFVHVEAFPLRGAHAEQACRECHAEDTEHALGELVRVSAGTAPALEAEARACASCHPSPHADAFVAAVGAELDQAEDRVCGACHDPEVAASFANGDARLERELHRLTGFALEDPHAEVACEECHAPAAALARNAGERFERFRRAYPGRDADTCEACHADPHGGQFERGAFAGEGCLACHERHAFAPSAFSIAEHARTSFPLAGSHEAVSCFECHVAPEGASAGDSRAQHVFAGTSTECAACHDDAHRGAFAALEEPHAARRNDCAHCHDTDSFHGAREGFDHAAWTSFALLGGHASVACERCHEPVARPDPAGRRFGWARGTSCADCHADPHVGQFVVDGHTDCARCHATGSFEEPDLVFDHARDSRFALDADHDELACSACHLPAPLPGGGTAVRFKPLGTRCGDCHDPREGRGR